MLMLSRQRRNDKILFPIVVFPPSALVLHAAITKRVYRKE